jgi:hypothetical protein
MNLVKVDNLKPGMILAQPVYNHQEVLLLEAGAKISKKNIRIFRSWGVDGVAIKGVFEGFDYPVEEHEASVKDTIEMELKQKFSDVLYDPIMVEIYKAAFKQLTKSKQNADEDNERN